MFSRQLPPTRPSFARSSLVHSPFARARRLAFSVGVASLALAGGAHAQTVAPATNDGGREGAAAVESVVITLSEQAGEIRQILMEGGEVNRDGLDAALRAREVASQAIEATGILGNPGDTQVTTTRMNSMDVANGLFERIAENLDVRVAAIRSGDAGVANRARLAVLDDVNELLDTSLLGGNMAPGDNVTATPGGAEPVLQQ